ncbi:unnamed protein product [Albugo candida]|uniref:Uncharacterized protein n=1 Tax=Albugo candida TaxID=65357 RepID=A0A024GHI0_9STRA|nr:unnamed protein product [Albugo candida]|eukprot:CCI46230.1 unnamed protein product [Albugo candida]
MWTDALKPFEKARNEQFDPFTVTTEEIIALVNLRKAPISFKHRHDYTIDNNPENSFLKWLKARFYIQERVGTLRDSQTKKLSKVQLEDVRKKEQEVLKEVDNMIEIEKEIHAALKNPSPKSISTA